MSLLFSFVYTFLVQNTSHTHPLSTLILFYYHYLLLLLLLLPVPSIPLLLLPTSTLTSTASSPLLSHPSLLPLQLSRHYIPPLHYHFHSTTTSTLTPSTLVSPPASLRSRRQTKESRHLRNGSCNYSRSERVCQQSIG